MTTITEEGVKNDLAAFGAKGYPERHGGRSPPPPGIDGSKLHYGSLHAWNTPDRRLYLHNLLTLSQELGKAKTLLADWKARFGVRVKYFLDNGTMTTAVRAGKVSRLLGKASESKVGLLNPEMFADSALAIHACEMINAWFGTCIEARAISCVRDVRMSKLVGRTTLALLTCAHEVSIAYFGSRSLTVSMAFQRRVIRPVLFRRV